MKIESEEVIIKLSHEELKRLHQLASFVLDVAANKTIDWEELYTLDPQFLAELKIKAEKISRKLH